MPEGGPCAGLAASVCGRKGKSSFARWWDGISPSGRFRSGDRQIRPAAPRATRDWGLSHPRGADGDASFARAWGAAILGIAFLVTTAAGSAIGRAPAPSSFEVSLSATPSGTDPLSVTFSATAITGVPTGFNWSFGDGQYFNGSGLAYSSPLHRYVAAGTFNVSVTVHEGTDASSQSLSLKILPPSLSVSIMTRGARGVAPFTASFNAVIAGGTGTVRSVVWDFGDGGSGVGPSIEYSYLHPGRYSVALNVTDSSGAFAVAHTGINVTGGSASTPASSGFVTADLATGLGLGAVVGALVAGLVLGRARRSVGAGPPSSAYGAVDAFGDGTHGDPVPDRTELADPVSRPPAPAAEEPWIETPLRPPSATPVAERAPPGAPAPPAPTAPPRRPGIGPSRLGESLRLSQRIVIHLSRLGRLTENDVALLGFTQLGMSDALQVRQNALTNVVRRLVAAGVLSEEVRHVRGQPRRLKVYQLTPRGEALARELRSRPRPTPTT